MKTKLLPLPFKLENKTSLLFNKYLSANWLIAVFTIFCLVSPLLVYAQSLGNGSSSSLNSFAITAAGDLYGWGAGGFVGDGTPAPRRVPVYISGYGALAHKTIVSVSSGHSQTLALDAEGKVYAWGGRLGNGTTNTSRLPVQVNSLSSIIAIAAGDYSHSLALRSDGTVYAWGINEEGQLGNGIPDNSLVPVPVTGISGITAIAAGGRHSLALKSDGTVYAWGNGSFGQLGNGNYNNSLVPMPVKNISGITAIAAGFNHSMALKSDGTVFTWGFGGYGNLGNSIFYNTTPPYGLAEPVQVNKLSDIKAIAAGGFHSLALKSDGTVYAWGRGNKGQLGDGNFYFASPEGVAEPVAINDSYFNHITAISAGFEHSMALSADGMVFTWGDNFYGQLGLGLQEFNPRALPQAVLNLTPAGGACDMALTTRITQAEPWYGMWGPFNGAGAIDLTVIGGTPPYTYKWNSGTTTQDLPVASPGSYSVTVTDNWGCTATSNIYVGVKNDFLRLITSHQNVTRVGYSDGAIDLTVIGGVMPATFRWSNGATTEDLTGVPAGTYSVVVTDAFGRTATTTVVISSPNTPLSLSATHQNVSVPGGRDGSIDLNVVGGVAPYSFVWVTGDYFGSLPFAYGPKTEDLPNAQEGIYTIMVTDAAGAQAMLRIKIEVGRTPVPLARKTNTIEDALAPTLTNLTVYPNPATDKATVNLTLITAGKYTLDLYDIRGAKVKTLATDKAQANQTITMDVNVADYAKGVYLLKLQTDQGVSSRRLMVGR